MFWLFQTSLSLLTLKDTTKNLEGVQKNSDELTSAIRFIKKLEEVVIERDHKAETKSHRDDSEQNCLLEKVLEAKSENC